ncbi:MAG: FkbM family methyltransferase [Candidatus Omnitrophica bacterium]|nr:FkbM family methyltransferase [Candidatus Omnitrophota bacterium]
MNAIRNFIRHILSLIPSSLKEKYLYKKAREIKQNLVIECLSFRKKPAEYAGIKIYIDRLLPRNMRRILYTGYYELSELAILEAYLGPDDVVMEIGAGIGFLSSYCAKQIGSDKVFAYEGNSFLKSYILKTYKLNGVSPRSEHCLVGEEDGEMEFFIMRDFRLSSTIEHSPERCIRKIKVPMKSFNREVAKNKPTFLILDVEGGEYDLIKSANFGSIKKILIETHPHIIGREKADYVKKRFRECGFRKKDCMGGVYFFTKEKSKNLTGPS